MIKDFFSNTDRYIISNMDCINGMQEIPNESVHSCVTDGPYGLSDNPDTSEVMRCWIIGKKYEHNKSGFFGKDWDSFIPGPEYWKEVYRILKPGGHLVAFSSSRTWDLLSIAIRFAGFENRDTIIHQYGFELPLLSWVYAQGFPHGQNISKMFDGLNSKSGDSEKWVGWSTLLKPAHEVILVFRKPLDKGTIAENVLRHETGAMNVGANRVGDEKRWSKPACNDGTTSCSNAPTNVTGYEGKYVDGRWPPNFIVTHTPFCKDNNCVDECPCRKINDCDDGKTFPQLKWDSELDFFPFIYCPKASTDERNIGCDDLPKKSIREEEGDPSNWDLSPGKNRARLVTKPQGNFHACLHPKTFVMTDYGYRSIGSLKIGDRVFSADGKFNTIIDTTTHSYCSRFLYEIKVRGSGIGTLSSDNHPFLIWRAERRHNNIMGGVVQWVEAKNIKKGDYSMTPVLKENNNGSVDDEDFWFIVGLYLAEGSPQKAGHGNNVYPVFSIHQKETDFVEIIRRYCNRFSNINVGVYRCKDSKGMHVIPFSSDLGDRLIELCGRGAHDKKLNPEVFGLSYKNRKAIVNGYLAGDGSKIKDSVREYDQANTVSISIASQIKFLAESIGYKVEIQITPPKISRIKGREVKAKACYNLYIYKRNNNSSGRKPSIPTYLDYNGIKYILRYVKSVDEIEYTGDVLNLTVENSPTFQTAIGMSHNTVKPIEIMKWLARLVTPPNGIVIDPFTGSASTGLACLVEGFRFIGFELDPDYYKIAEARMKYVEGLVCEK